MRKIYRKLLLLLKSIYLTVYYFFKACFSQNSLLGGNENFVVSLTTYGWRYNFVFLTIESILSQTIKPSAIYLWIHKNEQPTFFAKWFLNKQRKRGLKIKFVERDTKSFKKLSYILTDTDCSFDVVVTADDDVFYPRNWLRNFVNNSNFNTHVLCNRGRVITFEPGSTKLKSYKNWPMADSSYNSRNYILPTGVSGISYPIKSLDMRICNFDDIQKNCPFADDIWYKMVTTSNGYQSLILENKVDHFPPLLSSLTKGLEKMNVNEDLNTKQFVSSLSYFGLVKNTFEREFL